MPVPVVAVFLAIFACVGLSGVAVLKWLESRRKRQVNELLSTVARLPAAGPALLKDPGQERPPAFDRIPGVTRIVRAMECQIRQAGLDWTPERLAWLAALAGGAGMLLGLFLPLAVPPLWRAAVVAAIFASMPVLKLRRARARRVAEFEEQFPDALDFLARSMRAGHAFTISLEMLSEEMPDPLGREIRTLFNEQNLGAPLEVALHKLTERVPLLDVRFFASAVLLQKQTGGNLNEILTRLAYVIRERFRLKGQVKAASAHGRTTAGILTAMPILTLMALLAVAPGYIQGMLADPDGKKLLMGAVAAQVVGNFIIRRIVDIRV